MDHGNDSTEFVFDRSYTLMYLVEINGKFPKVPIKFIETLNPHTSTTNDMNETMAIDGKESSNKRKTSESKDELDLLLRVDVLGIDEANVS